MTTDLIENIQARFAATWSVAIALKPGSVPDRLMPYSSAGASYRPESVRLVCAGLDAGERQRIHAHRPGERQAGHRGDLRAPATEERRAGAAHRDRDNLRHQPVTRTRLAARNHRRNPG